jgi:peptidoglycan biosynthesis protein MviN/MurJ (putative lipid II flippase)
MLPWAANIAATLLAVVLYFALEGEVGKLDRTGMIKTLFASTGAALVAGAAAFFGAVFWNPVTKPSQFAALFVLGLVAMWIYYFITKFFGMPETKYFDRAMKRLGKH